jgi:ribosome-associated toxin RatA of RatAB toxin-antitoxin module
MKRVLVSVLLLAMCGSNACAAAKKEGTWKLVRDKQGIQVYTRTVKGSDFKAFKGVTVVKTSLASLVALVTDVEAAPQWLANCTTSKVLERINARETISYSFSKSPTWPVKNRDVVTHNVLSMDETTSVVTLKQTGKPDHIPEKKKVVRVKKIQCVWQFTPKKDGAVEVTYESLSDPGGGIPDWLVNSSIVSQPYQTLQKMRKAVMKEKYQKATLTPLGKGRDDL